MEQSVRTGPSRRRYKVSMNQKQEDDESEPLAYATRLYISSCQEQTWETK